MRDFLRLLATGRHPKHKNSVVLYDGAGSFCLVILGIIFVVLIIIALVLWGASAINQARDNASATATVQADAIAYTGDATTVRTTGTTKVFNNPSSNQFGLYLGLDGRVIFDQVTVPEGGTYYITVMAWGQHPSHIPLLQMSVNGGKPTQLEFANLETDIGNGLYEPPCDNSNPPAGDSNCKVLDSQITLPVQLHAGQNTVTIFTADYTARCYISNDSTDYCVGPFLRWVVVHKTSIPIGPNGIVPCGAATGHPCY